MNSRFVYPTFLRDCFSVETPITNRNNGCLWEGSKEKIAIVSEAGFNLENPKVNQSKKEQDNFYSHKIAIEILYRDRLDDGLGRGCA